MSNTPLENLSIYRMLEAKELDTPQNRQILELALECIGSTRLYGAKNIEERRYLREIVNRISQHPETLLTQASIDVLADSMQYFPTHKKVTQVVEEAGLYNRMLEIVSQSKSTHLDNMLRNRKYLTYSMIFHFGKVVRQSDNPLATIVWEHLLPLVRDIYSPE